MAPSACPVLSGPVRLLYEFESILYLISSLEALGGPDQPLIDALLSHLP